MNDKKAGRVEWEYVDQYGYPTTVNFPNMPVEDAKDIVNILLGLDITIKTSFGIVSVEPPK